MKNHYIYSLASLQGEANKTGQPVFAPTRDGGGHWIQPRPKKNNKLTFNAGQPAKNTEVQFLSGHHRKSK